MFGARAAPRPADYEATIALSGLGTEISDAMLMNMYRTYGPIVRVKHNGSNSAYDNVAIWGLFSLAGLGAGSNDVVD